jgi:nitrite reductase/ring-hydroxylating ferredoxin subunit
MTFVTVCQVSDVAPGEGRRIDVGPEPVALFNGAGGGSCAKSSKTKAW